MMEAQGKGIQRTETGGGNYVKGFDYYDKPLFVFKVASLSHP